jgi:hypothetical protein
MTRAARGISWIILAALLGACDAPGEGRKAEQGKRIGDALAQALERHHAARGRYPESLDGLFPKFVAPPLRSVADVDTDEIEFNYRFVPPDGYELVFTYSGPGINRCWLATNNAAPGWDCAGHY